MRVALFPTCLVDLYFPSVGEATVRLLRRLGCRVEYPRSQACCGQPAWNAGYPAEARRMAAALIPAFAGAEYVVSPSGSCASMVRTHLPGLFHGDADLGPAARALAARTYELSEFLVRVLSVDLRAMGATWRGPVTYHSSCHMSRELGVREEPLVLLRQIEGLELRPLERPDLCCGFGGTFSVKLPEVAEAMADDKLEDARSTGATWLVGADAGCLMHLQGRQRRVRGELQILHLAELLEQATRSAVPAKEGSPWR